MASSQARHRQRGQRHAAFEDCLAVFHRQNVVRRGKKRLCAGAEFLRRLRTRCGKGKSGFQSRSQMQRKPLIQQRASHCHNMRDIRCFRAEGKRIAPECGKKMHAGSGKLLRSGVGIGHRQGNHEVRTVFKCGADPNRFRQNRQVPPLYGTGTHTYRNGRSAFSVKLGNLEGMTVVEGIILGDDARKIHKKYLSFTQLSFGYNIKSLEKFSSSLYNKFV